MEDAMIINKSAYERGFAHGMIYKSETIELSNQSDRFAKDPDNAKVNGLGLDGLPFIGALIKEGDAYYR